jgi:hypothetical protein
LQLQPVIDDNSDQNLQISTDQYNNQQQTRSETTTKSVDQILCFFYPVNTDQPKVANFVSSLSWKKNFMKT